MRFTLCLVRRTLPVLLFFAVTSHSVESSLDDLEELLLSIPDPQRLKSVLFDITQKSHVAGTKGDWENAYYVRDKLRSFGFQDAHIEPVKVMMTYPQERPSLSTSFGFHAKLSEDILDKDATSGTTAWRNHTFLAYSPSGTASAKLVYANYGRPEDFDVLEKFGIPVNGSIVLMRYGECFRGLKIMNAEERGAVGSIIYSDPQQDGINKGPTFRDGGPWRPPSGVQRGSVQFNSKCAGDPWRLYLKENAAEGTKMKSVEDVCGYRTEDMIPIHVALPISYEDAQPLLARLGGGIAPDNFQGGLPLQYTMGPSDFDVTIQTNNTFFPRKIPNVIATLYADDSATNNTEFQSIILGNHRDAWVFGAVDPNSGTTSLLEVARTLKILEQQGWKPKRNVVFASWSGEEYGLLGSTAYAELRAEDSMPNVIAYLNVDCAVTGNATFNVSATHSLTALIRQVAEKVPAPPLPTSDRGQPNRTMASVWDNVVDTLGSGSDYTVFLDRLGIASLDMSYRGNYGVYHSVYDSFSWMEQQGDPSFEIHQAMTRMWALMAFRLASKAVLPIYMTPQAEQMNKDVHTVIASIERKFGSKVNTTKLLDAAKVFHDAAISIDRERELYELSSLDAQPVSDINRRLYLAERKFLGPGLPRRPWFRHVLQAPGFYLGYGSHAFPGIVEAVDIAVANSQILIAANSILNAATFLSTTRKDTAKDE